MNVRSALFSSLALLLGMTAIPLVVVSLAAATRVNDRVLVTTPQ